MRSVSTVNLHQINLLGGYIDGKINRRHVAASTGGYNAIDTAYTITSLRSHVYYYYTCYRRGI